MTHQVIKAAYSAPRLVEFGSVRNLTGGSRENGNDAGCCLNAMNGVIVGMCNP